MLAGNEDVAALLVAVARRVRDHAPNTAAQCLLLALRLLPPEAVQDRLELQLELARLVEPTKSRDVELCSLPQHGRRHGVAWTPCRQG
jgi:hypothetical protein